PPSGHVGQDQRRCTIRGAVLCGGVSVAWRNAGFVNGQERGKRLRKTCLFSRLGRGAAVKGGLTGRTWFFSGETDGHEQTRCGRAPPRRLEVIRSDETRLDRFLPGPAGIRRHRRKDGSG